jgi:hypothetical protein
LRRGLRLRQWQNTGKRWLACVCAHDLRCGVEGEAAPQGSNAALRLERAESISRQRDRVRLCKLIVVA